MSDTDSQESSSEWRTKSQKEKKRIHRKGYMHALTREQYDTILQLATGSFKVPVKERTREHNNARIRFYRNKKDFSARDRKLFYRGKEVIVKGNASNIVKKQFDLNCGSGSRSMSQQLKEKYANLSEATIKGCLSKSKDYQKAFAKFSNHSPPVPVTAKAVNERWQMDLIDMNEVKIQHDGKVYKWIFSVIDVFSRLLMLRPLTDKTSHGVKRQLSKLIADHGQPNIIQCDLGPEFKGSVSSFLRKKGIKVIRSRAYHPKIPRKV